MTPHPAGAPLGLLDPPLEATASAALEPGPEPRRSPRRGQLWMWSATSAPVALLLTAGIALGPRGINLLTPATLHLLDPVVPVALAALGVLVGLGLADRRKYDKRVFAAACLSAALTILVVSAGFAVVTLAAPAWTARPFWILILTSGICAATSLTLPTGSPLEPRTATTQLIEFGVVLPIVAGGFLLAWLGSGASGGGAVVLVAHASGITLLVAAAAWLLLSQAASATEERVFALSALLLVGGVAGILPVSAQFGGLVAGVFWRFAGRRPRDTISRDVLFVQHPLLVLVLLVAGARAELSFAALALGAGYVALRVVGQLAGGTLARRVAGEDAPPDLGLYQLPPGVFGVAVALNAVSVVGVNATMLLATVVVGTIGAELVAVLLPPRRVEQ